MSKCPLDIKKYGNNNFIELRDICNTNTSKVSLVYNIETEELMIIKKIRNNTENCILFYREFDNYIDLGHPLFPLLYGINEKEQYLVIEYVNGRTLLSIKELHLDESDKITIIFQLLILFIFLFENGFVYRDLKPNNVMIDENKFPVLIDFDRMVKINERNKDCKIETKTLDFSSNFVAPEVNYGMPSFMSDIYSIGKMIYFIMYEEEQKDDKILEIEERDVLIRPIIEKCINKDPTQRPSIYDLYKELFVTFESKIKPTLFKNEPLIYYLQGILYIENKYIKRDINKSIHYFQIASKQNHLMSNFALGYLYSSGEYLSRDINKAIYYFTLSSNQNHIISQCLLGLLYYEGKFISTDIKKAIYYLSLASNQNHAESQYILGLIYYKNDHIQPDITKAIYYFSLAAKQNHAESQYTLGVIYYDWKFISQDITKAIYYFSLAASQNHAESQYILGLIYFDGKYISRDITKAIYYLSLAANLNHAESQYILGLIYYDGKYISRDFGKAIFYSSLAANNNLTKSQFNLGLIYSDENNNSRDIKKIYSLFSTSFKSRLYISSFLYRLYLFVWF